MPRFETEHIRTIALAGQGGAGKTSLIEALLARTGALSTAGTVEKGTTVCDYDPREKAHGHSIKLACTHLVHDGTLIHLLDTPGYPDFLGQSLPALAAVETAAIVVNAQTGIELMTRRMMQWARARDLCRIIVINRIDVEDVDLGALLAQIQEEFGPECLPINLPAQGGSQVVDCFFRPDAESELMSVAKAHTALVDQVVEVDEELMALYLDQGHVTPEQLHEPFERALREGHLIPVCFVSARSGAGLDLLLEIFSRLMPNPLEGNPPHFLRGEGTEAKPLRPQPDPAKHVLAHVFKVEIDPFIGKLGVFRIHQGTVTPNTQLYVGEARKPFKVSHLYRLLGKTHIEVSEGLPGDICAVAKVDDIHYDAVLHDSQEDNHIHLEPLDFPQPVFGLAVEATRHGDEQKLADVLHKVAAEDPTLRVEHDAVLNETVIRGLGELHLRLTLEKMEKQYGLQLKTRPPRIPYRETLTLKAEGHNRHKKQTGGAGQFGEVFLRVEPMPRGSGFEFVDEVKGGVIPNQFIPAVEKGVRQVLAAGPLSGYPMQDVRVIVYDGKSHPVDSKEVAFVAAGRKAFLDACAKARPIVLEPIVNIEVIAPQSAMGDITGDLSSRRGQVNGTDSLSGGMIKLTGRVPLAELNGYGSRLKSLTGGAGSYTIEFSHYEQAPPNVQQQLAAAHKPVHAEE
ncbi:MAG TPA: elongation factor G [Burkholderiales bacterium]|jgi:elongation factor G|nr:elongation factor G [Burkholderiales bacterium]